MDFRTIWLATERKERESVARRTGTTYLYLQKVAGQYARPGLRLALKLQGIYPQLDLDSFVNPPRKVPVKPGPPRKRAARRRRA